MRGLRHAHFNQGAWGRVAQSVVDQVAQYQLDHCGVPLNLHGTGRRIQCQFLVALVGQGSMVGQNPLRYGAQIYRLRGQGFQALGACQVQQLAQDMPRAQGVLLNGLQCLCAVGRVVRFARPPGLQQHGGQRGAQLVRHV